MSTVVPDASLPVTITEPTFDQAVSMPLGTTAVVYCEGQFGEQDGKTANGLVRHSEKYEILSVIDSLQAGRDAGQFLDGAANGIPVLANLAEAIAHAGSVPDYLICGVAPADGLLSAAQREVLLDGIARGMHIINGLHEFLNDDPEFVAASLLAGVTITDVRRPKEKRDLHLFSGRIIDVTCPRIAVLGTDGAIGKRTTATLLVQALNAAASRRSWSAPARRPSSRAASTASRSTRSCRSSAPARWRTRSSRPSRARTPTSSSSRARARSATPPT